MKPKPTTELQRKLVAVERRILLTRRTLEALLKDLPNTRPRAQRARKDLTHLRALRIRLITSLAKRGRYGVEAKPARKSDDDQTGDATPLGGASSDGGASDKRAR